MQWNLFTFGLGRMISIIAAIYWPNLARTLILRCVRPSLGGTFLLALNKNPFFLIYLRTTIVMCLILLAWWRVWYPLEFGSILPVFKLTFIFVQCLCRNVFIKYIYVTSFDSDSHYIVLRFLTMRLVGLKFDGRYN